MDIGENMEDMLGLGNNIKDLSLVGMGKEMAITLLENGSVDFRLEKEDDEEFFLTMDLKPHRINLTLAGGKVISTRRG